jgi:hypothetical protein
MTHTDNQKQIINNEAQPFHLLKVFSGYEHGVPAVLSPTDINALSSKTLLQMADDSKIHKTVRACFQHKTYLHCKCTYTALYWKYHNPPHTKLWDKIFRDVLASSQYLFLLNKVRMPYEQLQ